MTLINRTAVKRLVIETSKRHRGGRFTRVSTDFLGAETALRAWIVDQVMRQGGGKTI